MILKFRNNSLPAGYFHQFEFDKRALKLKPKEEFTSGSWNGESYDIQAELWQRINIVVPVTEAEAEEIYKIRAANEIYVDDVQYELSEITDREQLGTTEFRKLTITLSAYTSTVENFRDRSWINDFEITIGSNSWYTNLQRDQIETGKKEVEWDEDSSIYHIRALTINHVRFYVSESDLETIQGSIHDQSVTITDTGTSTTDAALWVSEFEYEQIANDLFEIELKIVTAESNEVVNYNDDSNYQIDIGANTYYSDLRKYEVISEQEKVNWLRDAQVKFVNKKEIDYIRLYVTEAQAQSIRDDIFTEAVEITTPTPETYSPIYIEKLDLEQIAADLYEVDIKFVKDEIQEVPAGNYELYLYHENTDNVPSNWTTDRDTNGLININSVFQFIPRYEKEDEESEITARKLFENRKFKDKLSWMSIHTYESEAVKVQKYFNLVDTVLAVETDNFVAATGNEICIYPTDGGIATSYDEVLLPGMKFIVAETTYTVIGFTGAGSSVYISPTPAEILAEQSYQVEKRYDCKYAEITRTKNDIGIFELEYDIITNEDIYYPYA